MDFLQARALFLACTFWLADNYELQGRHQEAQDLFGRLLALCNDLGLLSEEYDPDLGRQLKFPAGVLTCDADQHRVQPVSPGWAGRGAKEIGCRRERASVFRFGEVSIAKPGGARMTSFKVGYFVGSLATASINRLLAKALVRLVPPELQMTEIPFNDLPLYSYDYDANYPPVATAFKNAIAAVDAVLFVTPEYNRSIPGALKNAIDWASRPYGKNAFTRKPSAVIGTSPGKIGTAIGQQHLRSILAFCNSPQMNSIEAYIQFEPGLITEDGQIANSH